MDFLINFLVGVVKMMVKIYYEICFPINDYIFLDMAARILAKYRISRYPASIARYKMLRHRPDTPNQSRYIFILSIPSFIILFSFF